MANYNNNVKYNLSIKAIVLTVMAGAVIVLGLMVGIPYYKVWQQEMDGETKWQHMIHIQ